MPIEIRARPIFGKFFLPIFAARRRTLSLFESLVRCNQMSGNPVRFGDGCATVSGYKLPLATDARASGRRERGQAPSQDTGLIVLVAIASAVDFSVKEKDET